jgi:hypothetical protein
MNKNHLKLYETFFSVNLPIFEDLIEKVCKKLDKEDKIEELKKELLYDDKKKFKKILNKKINKVKRKKTSYSMFLSDKKVLETLKSKFPNHNLSEINKEKGNYWRETIKKTDNLLKVYEKQAQDYNNLIKN